MLIYLFDFILSYLSYGCNLDDYKNKEMQYFESLFWVYFHLQCDSAFPSGGVEALLKLFQRLILFHLLLHQF